MSGRHAKPRASVPGRHRKPARPSRYLAPGLVAVVLLSAGGVGAHAAFSNSGSGPTASLRPTVPDIVTPPPSPPPSPTPVATSPAATPSPAPTATHHRPTAALRMVITGSVSWIEVRRPSGQVLASGLFRHGRHLTYRHGPLAVVIGNASAVTVTRAGAHTSRAGRPGEVVTLTVE